MVRSSPPPFPPLQCIFHYKTPPPQNHLLSFFSPTHQTNTKTKIQVQPLRRPHPPPLRSATPYELALTPRHCFRSRVRNLLPLRAEIPSCTSNGDYSGRVLVFSHGVWNEYFVVG